MTENINYFGQPIPMIHMTSVWRKNYRASRYLRKLTTKELTDRANDIVPNLLSFDGKTGKYAFNYNLGSDKIYRPVRNLDWFKMHTEVNEEFRLRGMKVPDLISMAPTLACERKLSTTDWAKRPDLIQASKPSLDNYEVPNLLFRYSKKEYNKEFVDFGRIRIVPASTYEDDLLTRAQRDNEMTMEIDDAGHGEVPREI